MAAYNQSLSVMEMKPLSSSKLEDRRLMQNSHLFKIGYVHWMGRATLRQDCRTSGIWCSDLFCINLMLELYYDLVLYLSLFNVCVYMEP